MLRLRAIVTAYCVEQAQFIRSAFACLVETRSVVHRGTYDGQPQCNVYSFDSLPRLFFPVIYKADGFERNVPLVVVHGHNDVIPAAQRLGK